MSNEDKIVLANKAIWFDTNDRVGVGFRTDENGNFYIFRHKDIGTSIENAVYLNFLSQIMEVYSNCVTLNINAFDSDDEKMNDEIINVRFLVCDSCLKYPS